MQRLLKHKIAADVAEILLLPVLLPVELLAGLCLLAGLLTQAASAILVLLFGTFLGALLSVLWRGLDIDCGCFGPGVTHRIGWDLIFSDSLLLLASVQVFLADRGRFGIAQLAGRLRRRPAQG
jgi:uncharacterized membrane protein YphA (DoxX/SURF4 family)